MGNNKKGNLGVGGITLLMSLAVLCVAVFAVLTMSTALADKRLSEKNAQLTRDYYTLDAKGVSLLDAVEKSCPPGAPDIDAAYAAAAAAANDAELTLGVEDGVLRLLCSLPAGEGRVFTIDATLAPSGANRWTIQRWTLDAAVFFSFDEGLPVMP